MEVLGVAMGADIRAWERNERRVGSLLALAVAALIVLAGVVAYFGFAVKDALPYWVMLGLLVLVLVFEVLLHALPARGGAPRAASAGADAGEGYVPSYARGPEPPRASARTITLRCGDCGTVFDLTDTGERPLYHACPGCGAEGVLRDPAPAPAPAAAPEAFAPPAAAPQAPVKRLKLRCGGCKEVFTIEDTGERPLRRPCPYCARVGEVK